METSALYSTLLRASDSEYFFRLRIREIPLQALNSYTIESSLLIDAQEISNDSMSYTKE